MRWFLFWAGGVIFTVVLLVVVAAGMYPKHVQCERFYDDYEYSSSAPDQTSTSANPDWHVVADCQGVQNNLYLSYYFMAIGAALFGIGFVVRG